MTIRERVKKLCSENNISMNKLECECGFAKGYLSKLDKSSPNSAKLQLIADFFGVTLDYIMTGVEKQVSITEQSELLIKIRNDKELLNALKKYMKLSDKKKKHVLDTIDMLSEV